MLHRRPHTGPVIYRDEVRDILEELADARDDVQRIRQLLEEENGGNEATSGTDS